MNAVERFRQVAENNSEKRFCMMQERNIPMASWKDSWIRFVPVLQN